MGMDIAVEAGVRSQARGAQLERLASSSHMVVESVTGSLSLHFALLKLQRLGHAGCWWGSWTLVGVGAVEGVGRNSLAGVC